MKKWAALAAIVCLVCLQTTGSVIYKMSQKSSRYTYSTFSALATAEAIKLAISIALYARSSRGDIVHLPLSQSDVPRLNWWEILQIVALAATYFANNHFMFEAYLRADAASVVMVKSTSSFVIAFLRSRFFRTALAGRQWRAIILQLCGLIITQYNACTATAILTPGVYSLLFASVLISAITSVWNESQLKHISLCLNLQNIVMYTGGMVLNVIGHHAAKRFNPDTPSFFDGYNAAAVGVIYVNACTGIAITAVYKYADAVVKSLALSVTTVMVTLLSWACFGLEVTPVNASGCIVIIVAVWSYSTS